MKKRGNWLYLISFGTFVLGLILGWLVPGLFTPISFIGTIYVNLLKLIVIPLLMSEIISAVARSARMTGKLLLRTIALFVVMFVVSYLLTAVLVSVIGPGKGLSLFEEAWDGSLASTTLADFFLSITPTSIFTAMADGSILPCILFAVVCGLAAAKTGANRLIEVTEDLRAVFSRILNWILYLTPLGVFSLIGNAVAQNGMALLGVCARYILCAWLGCVLVTVLVMMLPLWIFAKVNPLTYLKKVGRVWLISLSTCSSAATLPATIRCCNEEFGVPERITGIVVPLGCTIHMCGGAVSFCLLGLFTLQMAGTSITLGLFLYMLLVATLMNMAAPGIPGGGIVLGATYLTILGAPTGFIGLYSGIYRLLDMAYTTVNVTGDITANVLISRFSGEDRAK